MSAEADSIYENGGGAEREAAYRLPRKKTNTPAASDVIPAAKLSGMVDKDVHVSGWVKGAVFRYRGTDADGRHKLVTPKTKRVFLTTNTLCYTNRNKPTS